MSNLSMSERIANAGIKTIKTNEVIRRFGLTRAYLEFEGKK